MSSFSFSFRAVAPILITILIGMVFAAATKWDRSFFRKLNSLIFRILFPFNLFYSVYSVNSLHDINWRMLLFLLASVFICLFIGIIGAALFVSAKEQKGVIIQAAFRTNQAVIGIAIVTAISTSNKEAALGFASVSVCLGTILYNLIAVFVLNHYASSEKFDLKHELFVIIKNPLIIGSAVGLVCVFIRETLSITFSLENSFPALFSVISSLAKSASPMALFCLGASLDMKVGRALTNQITLGVSLRLIICPLITVTLAVLLKNKLLLTSIEMPGLISFAGSPVAVSSAIMVQEIGGDSRLANHLVVWSSLLSILTLFFLVYISRCLRLL